MINNQGKIVVLLTGLYLFFSCTYAGGKKESTPITDTLHSKPNPIMIDSIYALTPLFERKYDPQTGLEAYNEEFMKDRKTSIRVHTVNGWLIDIWTSENSGGLYDEFPPPPTFYCIRKIFYPNGKLKSVGKQYGSGKVGIWKEYNEEGKLIKEIDYDQDIKDARISFEEALQIYDSKGLINLTTGKGGYKFLVDQDNNVGIANPNISYNYIRRNGILFWQLFGARGDEKYRYTYEINAQTGEMNIQKEEQPRIEY